MTSSDKGMFKGSSFYGKIMKIIILATAIGSLLYIVKLQNVITILQQNPIVANTILEEGYSIIGINDMTVSDEMERGVVSEEIKVRVKNNANKDNYEVVANKIKTSYENYYGSERMGTVIINFTDKKNRLLNTSTVTFDK